LHVFEHVAVDNFDDVGMVKGLEVFDFAENIVDVSSAG
jgi:hypothetical protein